MHEMQVHTYLYTALPRPKYCGRSHQAKWKDTWTQERLLTTVLLDQSSIPEQSTVLVTEGAAVEVLVALDAAVLVILKVDVVPVFIVEVFEDETLDVRVL